MNMTNEQRLIVFTGNEFLECLKNPVIMKKYGWIPLTLPLALFAVDKSYKLANDIMDKGYECRLRVKKGEFDFSLNKPKTFTHPKQNKTQVVSQ